METIDVLEFWKILTFLKTNKKNFWRAIKEKPLSEDSIKTILAYVDSMST